MPGLGPLLSSDLLVLSAGQTQSEDRDHDLIHMMIDTDAGEVNTGERAWRERVERGDLEGLTQDI